MRNFTFSTASRTLSYLYVPHCLCGCFLRYIACMQRRQQSKEKTVYEGGETGIGLGMHARQYYQVAATETCETKVERQLRLLQMRDRFTCILPATVIIYICTCTVMIITDGYCEGGSHYSQAPTKAHTTMLCIHLYSKTEWSVCTTMLYGQPSFP